MSDFKAMKKLMINWAIFSLLLLSFSSQAKNDNILSIESSLVANAEQLVQQYFFMLKSGDIDAIRGLLGEEFLERGSQLLSNPTYGEILREKYDKVVFLIIGHEVKGMNSVEMNVRVDFHDGSRHEVFFMVKNLAGIGLRIVSESEIR